MPYPDQHPISEASVDALRVNTQGQHFQFEEAFFTDANGQEMHYIEAWMIDHHAKVSKAIPLAKSSVEVVDLICRDLRRMLELSAESEGGGIGPLGDVQNA
jgi:hypothetical protein